MVCRFLGKNLQTLVNYDMVAAFDLRENDA